MQEIGQDPEMRAQLGATNPRMTVRGLSLWYGAKQALKDVSFDLHQREVLAFIGPSGCGKSTALKCLNRMHDGVRGVRIDGEIRFDGSEIYNDATDPPVYRRRFGWVAQKPNPFPWSIYENIAYGARIHGLAAGKAALDDHVEDCLRRAMLWEEVKESLHAKTGLDLSGGQQQRLCIARALGTQPDVLLMDEPTGSIDPIATARVEELMVDLGRTHSVVVITHSMMQARRVADRVAHFHMGELVAIGTTKEIFTNPQDKRTMDFITGAVG